MRTPRRGGRTDHAVKQDPVPANLEAALIDSVERTGVRMDRLTALRTAGLITEEEFTERWADVIDSSASPKDLG